MPYGPPKKLITAIFRGIVLASIPVTPPMTIGEHAAKHYGNW